jgi:hypothetical protein
MAKEKEVIIKKGAVPPNVEALRKLTAEMFNRYQVVLHFTTPFANGMPKDPKEIEGMLTARMPLNMPDGATPLPKLIEQVTTMRQETEPPQPVGDDDGEAEEAAEIEAPVAKGHVAFFADEKGLYYEGRCIRSHCKDCSNVLREYVDVTALKSKIVNRLWIEEQKVYVMKSDDHNFVHVKTPDGTVTRIIHVTTPQGKRNSFKQIDYVDDAVLIFTLKVLNDGFITEDLLRLFLTYGGTHGMGQERSTGYGNFTFDIFKKGGEN